MITFQGKDMKLQRQKQEYNRKKNKNKIKKAQRCIECIKMQKGWCNHHKDWCYRIIKCKPIRS